MTILNDIHTRFTYMYPEEEYIQFKLRTKLDGLFDLAISNGINSRICLECDNIFRRNIKQIYHEILGSEIWMTTINL